MRTSCGSREDPARNRPILRQLLSLRSSLRAACGWLSPFGRLPKGRSEASILLCSQMESFKNPSEVAIPPAMRNVPRRTKSLNVAPSFPKNHPKSTYPIGISGGSSQGIFYCQRSNQLKLKIPIIYFGTQLAGGGRTNPFPPIPRPVTQICLAPARKRRQS